MKQEDLAIICRISPVAAEKNLIIMTLDIIIIGLFFPSKEEQVEQLKKYRQTLTEEIDEIDKRLKELE